MPAPNHGCVDSILGLVSAVMAMEGLRVGNIIVAMLFLEAASLPVK